MATKIELFRSVLEQYLTSDKQEKTNILDELAGITRMHRKAVNRALLREQMRDSCWQPKQRGPKTRYGPMVTAALKELWEMSRGLCAERLIEAIPDYLEPLMRDGDWKYSSETTALLKRVSIGTMKSRIAGFQKARHPKGISTTKPSELKEIIPVRRGPWENPGPGDGEIDSVVHCGSTLAGNMAYTINFTSIATGWCEQAAQMNKGQRG